MRERDLWILHAEAQLQLIKTHLLKVLGPIWPLSPPNSPLHVHVHFSNICFLPHCCHFIFLVSPSSQGWRAWRSPQSLLFVNHILWVTANFTCRFLSTQREEAIPYHLWKGCYTLEEGHSKNRHREDPAGEKRSQRGIFRRILKALPENVPTQQPLLPFFRLAVTQQMREWLGEQEGNHHQPSSCEKGRTKQVFCSP